MANDRQKIGWKSVAAAVAVVLIALCVRTCIHLSNKVSDEVVKKEAPAAIVQEPDSVLIKQKGKSGSKTKKKEKSRIPPSRDYLGEPAL